MKKPQEDSKVPVKKKKFGGPQEGSGRPKKEITAEQVYDLALIHCTAEEIAAVLKCHKDTIYARFSDVLHAGHKHGQMSMKRKMHQIAMEGDVKMLIWLSKQRLGYKDVIAEQATQINFNVYTNEVPS